MIIIGADSKKFISRIFIIRFGGKDLNLSASLFYVQFSLVQILGEVTKWSRLSIQIIIGFNICRKNISLILMKNNGRSA
jgi:hypothetical protein